MKLARGYLELCQESEEGHAANIRAATALLTAALDGKEHDTFVRLGDAARRVADGLR